MLFQLLFLSIVEQGSIPLFTYSLSLSFVSLSTALQISCGAYWDVECCHYTAGKGCILCTAVAMVKYRANLPYKQQFKGKPLAFLAFPLDISNSSGSMYSEAVQISLCGDKTSPPSPATVSRILSVLQQLYFVMLLSHIIPSSNNNK